MNQQTYKLLESINQDMSATPMLCAVCGADVRGNEPFPHLVERICGSCAHVAFEHGYWGDPELPAAVARHDPATHSH